MSDLNELSELDKRLKDMINKRNNFVPQYVTNPKDNNINQTYMAVEEHGRPHISQSKYITRMAIQEHGQPHITSHAKGYAFIINGEQVNK